jgi:hypothetical protein
VLVSGEARWDNLCPGFSRRGTTRKNSKGDDGANVLSGRTPRPPFSYGGRSEIPFRTEVIARRSVSTMPSVPDAFARSATKGTMFTALEPSAVTQLEGDGLRVAARGLHGRCESTNVAVDAG